MPKYQRSDDARPSSGRVITLGGVRFTVSLKEALRCAQIIKARALLGASRAEAEKDARRWLQTSRRERSQALGWVGRKD